MKIRENHRKETASVRYPGERILSIDTEVARERFERDSNEEESARSLYDRRWALAVLEEVERQMAAFYKSAGHGDRFEALRPFLLSKASRTTPYIDIASRLGMKENAVKGAMHRMRTKFKKLVREEVRQSLKEEVDLDDELRELFG